MAQGCERCGSAIPTKRNARFCGRVCSNKGRKPRAVKRCAQCGKMFSHGQGVTRFCSRVCYGGYRSAKITGVNSGLYKKTERVCAWCKSPYLIQPHKADTSRFCSNPCRAASRWRGGYRESVARRRARIKGTAIVEDKIDRRALYERDKGRCYICDKAVPLKGTPFDHIVPLARGGQHTSDNLRLCCRSCNSRKSDKPLEAFVCFIR